MKIGRYSLVSALLAVSILTSCSKPVQSESLIEAQVIRESVPAVKMEKVEVSPDIRIVDRIADLDAPESLLDRFSYVYGYLLFRTAESQGFMLDTDYFAKGALDAGLEEGLYSVKEMDEILQEYQVGMLKMFQEKAMQLAEENLVKAEEFLESNRNGPNVQMTDSGLQYQVVVQGDGEHPTSSDRIVADYTLTLLDGTVVDSSYRRGEPSIFTVGKLLDGFEEGVKLMNVGSKFRFWVHPSLAYGQDGDSNVPPNSLLIIDITLDEIK